MTDTSNNDIDKITEVERLAGLDVLDYEATRVDAAQRLGVRASVLDREITRVRRKLGLDVSDDDNGQGRAVKFTDVWAWPEVVDGDFLATTLARAVKTYAVLSDAQADAIAIWAVHSWMIDRFSISPRLAITSPTKGCGKTTVLRLLGQIARRPKRAGSISPPALFRAVEKFQPTLLLDETEKYVEHGGDLHALINEGHAQGATVLRVLGEKMELREFRIYCALAFCRNGRIPDDLEQRSIVIEMQRRRPDEPLAELPENRPCAVLQDLARMCARWSEDNAASVGDVDPDMGSLINRLRDNWHPLFSIGDAIGGDWPDRIREAAAILVPRESESTGPMLLADIKATFAGRKGEWADRMFSEMVTVALAAIEGSPWAEYGKARKPISKNQLAQLLKAFKIVPDTVTIGTKRLKGYYRHQFQEAWERYLAPAGVDDPYIRNQPTAAGTFTPFPNVTDDPPITFQKDEKPLGDGDGYGCTDRNADNAPSRVKGDDQPGFNIYVINQIARDIEEWVYGRRCDGDTTDVQIEEEARRRVIQVGVMPEWIEVETDRVLQSLYEGQEAGRSAS